MALTALEDSGIITVYDNSPHRWMMSHDVYEELIIKHILTQRYQEGIEAEKVLEGFGLSLRARKLYRIWLEDAASLQAKLDVTAAYDLGGIAFWKLGLESSEVWPEIEAYMNR